MRAPQWWWGHRAYKPTQLYICGTHDVPPIPYRLRGGECVIRLDTRRADGTYVRRGDADYRPRLGDAGREATPKRFAEWLVALARNCKA